MKIKQNNTVKYVKKKSRKKKIWEMEREKKSRKN